MVFKEKISECQNNFENCTSSLVKTQPVENFPSPTGVCHHSCLAQPFPETKKQHHRQVIKSTVHLMIRSYDGELSRKYTPNTVLPEITKQAISHNNIP